MGAHLNGQTDTNLLTHCILGICSCFLLTADFLKKINLLKTFFQKYYQNVSLDPDQARRFLGPYLGANCLPRLSADITGRQRFK